jgi:hypothetical protein
MDDGLGLGNLKERIWNLNPDFRYMPGHGTINIYMVQPCICDIHGIYIVYLRIYQVYPSDWIYMVYPSSWVYPSPPLASHGIYRDMVSYPWICMVYHLMCIHGIYIVYRGIMISMDIPSFLKPDFAAGPGAAGLIQCAHACQCG